jgi:hypothetical protein
MAQTCGKCSRPNPPEAVYCYFDGFVLAAHARNGGPVAIGAKRFHTPLVFPSGRTCHSFDELSLACQEEWKGARDLLKQGYFEQFLGGIGRMDLALAAREAARFPDPDRGLDQLLAKLPSGVLDEPKLKVEPQEVNLGVLAIGDQRQFALRLENQGMRLLYGSITCEDGLWLALGDGPGGGEKHFQFQHELVLPVHVRGDRLRASNKPVVAKLEVESNGGKTVVAVKAEVPVKPFPPGILGGAKSPRQVAEKAKAHPKESAVLFEKGAVAAWYKSNGWTYPVQGPSASGLGAVQQFFEALGLTPPPKVRINQQSVALKGNVGDQLRHALEVSSEEKRPVYAHASSDQPWLEVGRPKLNGRMATIAFSIPSVPDKPGETLTARLTVQSNGNQRFVVPVTLEIGGGFTFGPPVAAAAPLPPMQVTAAAVLRRPRGKPAWLHLLPAAVLLLAVFGVVLFDLSKGPRTEQAEREPRPDVPDLLNPLQGPTGWTYGNLKDSDPRLGIEFDKEMRFGIMMLGVKDPNNPDKFKRLTFEQDGGSNSTIVKIDGAEYWFGRVTPTNRWVRDSGQPEGNRKKVKLKDRVGWTSEMDFTRDKVRVIQHVEVVPGSTGFLDTVLVYYTIQNNSDIPKKVGIRVMLDTYIGANDGVPFTIPDGRKGFLDTMEEFNQKQIPDYVEAVENPDDPSNLGTVARLGLKGIKLPDIELEDIEKMVICQWPDNRQAPWGWKYQPINLNPSNKDSCVVLYWGYQQMNAHDVRRMAFTYGLNKLEISGGGNPQESALALSVPSSVLPDREFRVTAYVYNAKAGQTVTLQLPDGLSLAADEADEKTVVEDGKRVQVSWKVKSGKAGTYPVEASSGKAKTKPHNVVVKANSIFG